MRKGIVLLAAIFALALTGCAQQGGGLTVPTPGSQLGNKNIVPSAEALTLQITQFCNGQAQVDYRAIALFCAGKAPTLPVSVATAYSTAAANFSCEVYGYTNANNKLIVPVDSAGALIMPVLSNCPSGAAPAPVTAPSGAATKG